MSVVTASYAPERALGRKGRFPSPLRCRRLFNKQHRCTFLRSESLRHMHLMSGTKLAFVQPCTCTERSLVVLRFVALFEPHACGVTNYNREAPPQTSTSHRVSHWCLNPLISNLLP